MPPMTLFPVCLLLSVSLTVFSQVKEPNNIGGKAKILTLSNGKYDEFFAKESLERVGSVVINRRTRKIEKLMTENSVNGKSFNIEQSRFLSVDPLSKKFPELSPYQYASNRPIDGRDLDGLEWNSTGKYYNWETNKFEIDYKVTLSLSDAKNILHQTNDQARLGTFEGSAEHALSKLDAQGSLEDPIISTDVIFTDKEGPLKAVFFNAQTIQRLDPKTGATKVVQNESYAGKTDVIGQTQENTVFIPLSNEFILDQPGRSSFHSQPKSPSDEEIGRSFSHELGHTAGLRHVFPGNLVQPYDLQEPFDIGTFVQGLLPEGHPSIILNNLMNSPGNPIKSLNADIKGLPQGTGLTTDQRKKIESTVQEQQPKSN
jgi:hypothetical protein